MTIQLMMQADAVLLVLIALSCGMRVCEERDLHWFPRLGLVGVACFACFQSAWLLGIWTPGASGYPWPRLSFDFALFLHMAWRTLSTMADNREVDKRVKTLSRARGPR